MDNDWLSGVDASVSGTHFDWTISWSARRGCACALGGSARSAGVYGVGSPERMLFLFLSLALLFLFSTDATCARMVLRSVVLANHGQSRGCDVNGMYCRMVFA